MNDRLDRARNHVNGKIEIRHHDLRAPRFQHRPHAHRHSIGECRLPIELAQPRNLFRQHAMERRIDQMGLHVVFDRRAHNLGKRSILRMRGHPFDAPFEIARMTPHQLAEQRVLVGKILIERTDAHTRFFRHSIGREGVVTVLDQNASRRIDDYVDGGARTVLFGLFPWHCRLFPGHYGAVPFASIQYEQKLI